MNKLDQLISKFKDAKEKLSKTGEPNELSMSEETMKDEKGINTGANPKMPGRSKMGLMNAIGAPEQAKAEAKKVLKEMKKLPKPKLVKMNDQENLAMSDNGQWSIEKVSIDKTEE